MACHAPILPEFFLIRTTCGMAHDLPHISRPRLKLQFDTIQYNSKHKYECGDFNATTHFKKRQCLAHKDVSGWLHMHVQSSSDHCVRLNPKLSFILALMTQVRCAFKFIVCSAQCSLGWSNAPRNFIT